jgi:uncharacterized integral membrane protein
MRFFKVIFSSFLGIIGIVFIIQNLEVLTRTVELKLDIYVRSFTSPSIHLWGLILFTFFLGVFTASLYGIYELIKQRHTIRQLKHNLEVLGHELKRASTPEGPSSRPEPEGPSRPE